jgi:pimeloyl-ACP methyl ester carboxylesterase
LVGHFFGESMAMMAAKLFHDHIDKLILIEPNPFYLLRDLGHDTNYNEVMAL